ncbi:MAG: glycoside hydrolase family 3 protein [Balneolaceae bacterium]
MKQPGRYLLLFLVVIFSHSSGMVSCAQQPPPESSLDEKIGQMLMIGFRGMTVEESAHIYRDLRDFHLGGVLLFDVDVPSGRAHRNINDPDQVQALIRELQSLASMPLFVAVDQEGGRVARLKADRGFTVYPSAETLGTLNEPDTTQNQSQSMARQLALLGFNVNFAPVVDVNTNPLNPIIGRLGRSFSSDPETVIRHAAIFSEAHIAESVLPVIKHFPGHGSAWNDSHVGMADVSDTWDELELIPFRSLIQSVAPLGVMTAHVFNASLDPELPATLSGKVQTGLLREELGFEGVLFSDDMQMEAIRSFYGLDVAVQHAIEAGVDILVFANNSVYEEEVVPEVVSLIHSLIDEGIITEERINQSYRRITTAKRTLGIIRE